MVKQTTSLTIDAELLNKARERGVNISELAQEGIEKGLGIESVNMQRVQDRKDGKLLGEDCFICKNLYDYATKEEPNKGLVWLWPDERWICHKCLTRKSKII